MSPPPPRLKIPSLVSEALLITIPALSWLISLGRQLTHVLEKDPLLEGLPSTEDVFQCGLFMEEGHSKSI